MTTSDKAITRGQNLGILATNVDKPIIANSNAPPRSQLRSQKSNRLKMVISSLPPRSSQTQQEERNIREASVSGEINSRMEFLHGNVREKEIY